MEQMNASLWRTPVGDYAVCDGPGPKGVLGYVTWNVGCWVIKGDILNRRFLDLESAAATLINRPLPAGVSGYIIERDGEQRTVVTYPDVLDLLNGQGWRVVAKEEQPPTL